MGNGTGWAGAGNERESLGRLRIEFVALLFALATAEVGAQFGNLAADHRRLTEAAASYSHLTLALIIIATSWVGWSRSPAAGNKLPLERIFSVAFVVLMLDVALVVFYFIIARGVEKPSSPNAGHETFWVMMIFAVYVAWDLTTKAVAADPDGVAPSTFWDRLTGPFLERGWISMLCAVIAFGIWWFLNGVTTVRPVVATDITLVALDLFFRALKQRHTGWSIFTGIVGALAFAAAFTWS